MDSIPEGTYDDRDNDLKLDPGVPARRNRSSGCKCVLITILISIASLAAFFIGVFLVNKIHHGRERFGEPHAALLYKTKSADTVDPAAVVRPLIDEKQTFDIVATVWLRTNDSSFESTSSTLPAQKPIFTGKVFQGLTLKDKSIHTTVNYTVPTEIFKNLDLKTYDLRASFVLIPTSPSLLDNLSNYSSWRNEKILFPPFRSWPDTGPAPTLQDKAIDSFGVSIDLVRFFGIRSRCGPTTSNAANASEHTPEDVTGDDDLDDETDTDNSHENYSTLDYPFQPIATSKGKPVLESHPYIVSHSFIRAVDMTKLYDRKAYNQVHNKLKTDICGLASSPPNYDWRSCNLLLHENMDTRLQLKIAEGKGNKKTKHWAYAPSLSLSKSAYTPKDLVPVPVNREDCTKGGRFNDSEPLLPDQEFVDITWQIIYSGRTPLKLMLSETFAGHAHFNMTEKEEFQQEVQHATEIFQGVFGNRVRKGSHPRRMFFISILGIIFRFIISAVNIRYWHTRSSTIGISKFATILFAVITLGNYILASFPSNYKEHLLLTLFAAIASLPLELSPFLMLKAIWRMEFGWNRKKGKDKWTEKRKEMKRRKCEVPVPSVNFAKATHAERASDRLDARTPWIVKLSLFISCCLAYFFFSPATSLFLIPPLGLPRPRRRMDEHPLRTIVIWSLISPGLILGSGLQLWFNYQSRTFAGKYKLNAILDGINLMLNMLQYSTRLLGYRGVRDGFSVHDLMDAFIVVGWCYQAVVLPTVSQGEVDDEEE